MQYVDSAVQTVLSSSRLKLAHPGNAKLTQVYPTPSETTSVLAQAINHRGQFRASSNSKSFAGRSDFVASSSALLSEFAVVGSVTVTNGVGNPVPSAKPNEVGWIFQLVDSIEITFSNSLMQAMIITGVALREYSLLCCCSKQERIDMMKTAGQFFPTTFSGAASAKNTYSFCLPLTFLSFAIGSLRNSWPIDSSVLAGPMQIAINWRTINYAFVALDDTFAFLGLAGLPTQFDSLTLIAKTTQLQDAAFSVKKAMMMDPQLVYSLPARYITTVSFPFPLLQAGNKATINLSSAPSGMLEGLIVTVVEDGGPGGPPVTGLANLETMSSVPFDQVALEFGGQYIFRCDSYVEYIHYQRSQFGDTLEHENILYFADGSAGLLVAVNSPILFIPLVDNGASVLRGHTNENLPSYGGSQLQLTVTPSIHKALDTSVAAWQGPEVREDNAPTGYTIHVTYLVSALVEISQGTVDLQL